MKKKIVIDAEFGFLKNYIEHVVEKFGSLGEVIHDKRNIIRTDKVDNKKVVIKSYRRIYFPNRFRYTYLYPSKAQRAYEYGKHLLECGFLTPKPIAFIESFKGGLIHQSFFISEYTDFQPLNTIHMMPIADIKELLIEFARYTYKLHSHGIYHVDYSTGNVLFKKIDGQYVFSLIDNNRMQLGPVTFNKGIKNLERLGLPVELLTDIGKEYARLWDVDEVIALERLFHYKRKRLEKGALKGFGKRILVKVQDIKTMFLNEASIKS